jgi:hypothetical protein
LPPTRTGATPLRLVSGAAPVVAARHDSGVCANWGEKLEDGEDLKAKGLVKSWGHLWFLFIGLMKEIVASGRGLRSWLVSQKNLEGGEVSLTNPPSGRLEFKAESYSVDWLG